MGGSRLWRRLLKTQAMREQHAVYMAGSGRINLAGLNPATVSIFARAYAACLQEEFA